MVGAAASTLVAEAGVAPFADHRVAAAILLDPSKAVWAGLRLCALPGLTAAERIFF